MLHVLDVPKGTKFFEFTRLGGSITAAGSSVPTHWAYASSIMLLIPYPGKRTVGSYEIDCGWIANTADHNGQKDVEQLDLDGIIVPKRYWSSLSPFATATDNLLSPNAATFMVTTIKRAATTRVRRFSHILPYMGTVGTDSSMVGVDSNRVTHPWMAVVGAKWLGTRLVYCIQRTMRVDAPATDPIYVDCYKFSDDWTMMVQWQLQLGKTGSALYGWQALLTAVENDVRGSALLKTPSLSTLSYAWETTVDFAPTKADIIDQFKIPDRTYVFRGELNPVWGDLAYDCYNQIQLWGNNGLAYLRDIAGITSAARSLIGVAKNLLGSKNFMAVSKELAGLFLSIRYGWCLTTKDTLSLVDADYERAYPQGRCKRSSAYTYFRNGYTITSRMAVYCRPYADCVSELAALVNMFDLDFTLENIWDMVPLSFVVDWVANVGDVLDRLDTLGEMEQFSIFLTGKTLKVETTLAVDEIRQLTSMSGNVSAKYYKRAYTTDVTLPSLASSRVANQKFNNWLEGSALVIQRLG